MALVKKLIPFLIIFGTIFYFIRTSSLYDTRLLLSNIDETPYLYAVVGTIFGVLAGFAIQQEWEEWNALTDAVRGEVDGLEKLYLWSSNFPEKIKDAIHAEIKRYLELIIKEGWRYSEKGEKSKEVEDIITDLNNSIYKIFDEAPQLMPTSFALLSTVLNHRSARLQHSAEHMPPLLRNTLRFAAFLLIALSMFIAIKDIYLAFVFTASIASLAYAIFLVLTDLDNPLKPGDWHLTTKDYRALLAKIA
ncbi:MAG: hypothetical protein ABR884_02380 [Minisyncoccia bacterium]|jgi:hypothetical protein